MKSYLRGFRFRTRLWLLVLSSCVLAGCSDSLLEPVPQASTPSLVRRPSTPSESRSAFACFLSVATLGGPHAYRYRQVHTRLPAAVIAPDFATTRYRFRVYDRNGKIQRLANCVIPRTRSAVALMNRRFRIPGSRPVLKPVQEPGDITIQECYQTGENQFYCDDLGGPPPEDDDPPEDNLPCDPWTGCGSDPDDGGRNGGSSPCSTCEAATPCSTGNSVIDSQVVQDAFNLLWQASDYELPQPQRREQGGWIFRDADGTYRFETFPPEWERKPCSIEVPPGTLPPPGAVGWAHTHPFSNGEKMTECDWQEIPGLGKFPIAYRNAPSQGDDEATKFWRSQGYDILGYMIDADRITVFNGDGTPQSETPYTRCGY